MSDAKSCLVVFARAPLPGLVKTRLLLRPDQAARLYTAFIADVLDKGVAAGFPTLRLYVEGAIDDPSLLELAIPRGYTLRPQRGNDLGERMYNAVADELESGAGNVVLIGSDSPTLPVAYLEKARALLTHAAPPVEVVLGPATDGGYYLIGLQRAHLELFSEGIPWSTAGVLPTTLLRLAQLAERGVCTALLPFFYDCDTPDDLRLLAAHLRFAESQPERSDDAAPPSAAVAAAFTRLAMSELSLI